MGEGEGGLDCRRYVQPPDLEWDWIAAGMYSPQSQSCFGFGVDGIAAGTGGEEGGSGLGCRWREGARSRSLSVALGRVCRGRVGHVGLATT